MVELFFILLVFTMYMCAMTFCCILTTCCVLIGRDSPIKWDFKVNAGICCVLIALQIYLGYHAF